MGTVRRRTGQTENPAAEVAQVRDVDPGPFLESILPDVSAIHISDSITHSNSVTQAARLLCANYYEKRLQIRAKILGYLDHQSLLTLRGVSVSFRAMIDYSHGLNVVANDNYQHNTRFVRRVLAKSLTIDYLRVDRKEYLRDFLKYPAQAKELHVRCLVPRAVLHKNLLVLTNLVRIGFKGRALTEFDFFPANEGVEARPAFPFATLESLSLEINFDEWEPKQATVLLKNQAWQNMTGYLERTRSPKLKKFCFEFLDGQATRNEFALVDFLTAHKTTLLDLSVKITFDRSSGAVANPERDSIPHDLRKLCLRLGQFNPNINNGKDSQGNVTIGEPGTFGPFWTYLYNYCGVLQVADISFELQDMESFLDWSVNDWIRLRVVKIHDLRIYPDPPATVPRIESCTNVEPDANPEPATKPEVIDFSEFADFPQLEELHVHHAFFNIHPRGERTQNQDKYFRMVKNKVRRAEVTGLGPLFGLPNLRKLAFWGLLTPTNDLANLLNIKKLESLDIRGCGVRGIFGIGRNFFEKLDTAPGRENLPQYLGLKSIRIEDVNNDEVPRYQAYYQGSFAQQQNYPITGHVLLR